LREAEEIGQSGAEGVVQECTIRQKEQRGGDGEQPGLLKEAQ
jgi:hypothetical protein